MNDQTRKYKLRRLIKNEKLIINNNIARSNSRNLILLYPVVKSNNKALLIKLDTTNNKAK